MQLSRYVRSVCVQLCIQMYNDVFYVNAAISGAGKNISQ